jgi:glycolate oxidase iron-sulfur subunit
MQTNFTPAQLADPVVADADRILKDCVHYGFCTAVCPTYVLLRDENDAPRGRIELMRRMLESGKPPDAATVGYIDRCLSCNSCMTTCAAKVDYMHLADIGRAYIETHYKRPLADRLFRALVAATVPDAGRFRLAVQAAALARPFADALPRRLANMVAMAPRRLPRAEPGPALHAAEGRRLMRVALLAGCAQAALAPRINQAAVRLLTRHGCEVVVAAAAACCGAFTLHMGKERLAKASARAAIAAWTQEIAAGGLDAVVVTASGCGTTVKDYGRIFAHDPDVAPLAARIAALARDVTEVLHDLGLRAPERPVPLAVAYHDACSLQHAQKVTQPPRTLLAAAGFDVREVPERHFCCGSAGAYNLLQPAIARQLGERKAGNIESTGAAAVAAGNLGCMTQIAMYSGLPVVHTVELLDWATGGPLPPALAGVALPAPVAARPGPPAGDVGAAIW